MKRIHNPLVSVIIPTYNRSTVISRAIQSIIKQDYDNWELLIVDDGSNDGTPDIVESYIREDKRIKYFYQSSNQGACVARNEGIKNACGDFITFLDSDDEYLPDKLRAQLDLFYTSPVKNLGVVSCGMDHVNPDGLVYISKIPKFNGNVLDRLLSKKYVGAGTPSLMIHKKIVDDGIFFDPKMPAGQDYDFLVRVSQKYNFDFVGKSLVRVHHHSMDRVYNKTSALKAVELQYQKYKDIIIEKNQKIPFVLKHADLLFV